MMATAMARRLRDAEPEILNEILHRPNITSVGAMALGLLTATGWSIPNSLEIHRFIFEHAAGLLSMVVALEYMVAMREFQWLTLSHFAPLKNQLRGHPRQQMCQAQFLANPELAAAGGHRAAPCRAPY